MNSASKNLCWVLAILICITLPHKAEAKRRRHRRRHHYSGPPPTHPVVLWARTLSESTDHEQRRIAAFKLSQYSQPIYQDQVINTLVKCIGDTDVEIKVLCTKAMGHAGTKSNAGNMRAILLEKYRTDPMLRSTIVRAFITRGDNSDEVQNTFLDSAKKTTNNDELLTLLSYFEAFGSGSGRFVQTMVEIYQGNENVKVRRAVVQALADRAQGQDAVIALLSECADNKDTPLALTCLSGLQLQAKKDVRAWSAVEKTVQSSDPDVLMATLDVINALPEMPNPKIAKRLVEIIGEIDDSELQEKAILALGNCGDQSEEIVNVLIKLLKDNNTDDSTRIAAALVLGKQASQFPEPARDALSQCSNDPSQSLKLACSLGMKDFEARKNAQPAPGTSPGNVAATANTGTPPPATASTPSPTPAVSMPATTNPKLASTLPVPPATTTPATTPTQPTIKTDSGAVTTAPADANRKPQSEDDGDDDDED